MSVMTLACHYTHTAARVITPTHLPSLDAPPRHPVKEHVGKSQSRDLASSEIVP